jgi:hypothetical protein
MSASLAAQLLATKPVFSAARLLAARETDILLGDRLDQHAVCLIMLTYPEFVFAPPPIARFVPPRVADFVRARRFGTEYAPAGKRPDSRPSVSKRAGLQRVFEVPKKPPLLGRVCLGGFSVSY